MSAGRGWSSRQDEGVCGRHLCLSVDAGADNLVIKNNIFIFCDAASNAFCAPEWTTKGVPALRMDHNLCCQPEGVMITWAGKQYTMAELARYQQDWGLEPHSLAGAPRFVYPAAHDFRLQPGSLGVDAGADLGIRRDFLGLPVPQGQRPTSAPMSLPRGLRRAIVSPACYDPSVVRSPGASLAAPSQLAQGLICKASCVSSKHCPHAAITAFA